MTVPVPKNEKIGGSNSYYQWGTTPHHTIFCFNDGIKIAPAFPGFLQERVLCGFFLADIFVILYEFHSYANYVQFYSV